MWWHWWIHSPSDVYPAKQHSFDVLNSKFSSILVNTYPFGKSVETKLFVKLPIVDRHFKRTKTHMTPKYVFISRRKRFGMFFSDDGRYSESKLSGSGVRYRVDYFTGLGDIINPDTEALMESVISEYPEFANWEIYHAFSTYNI